MVYCQAKLYVDIQHGVLTGDKVLWQSIQLNSFSLHSFTQNIQKVYACKQTRRYDMLTSSITCWQSIWYVACRYCILTVGIMCWQSIWYFHIRDGMLICDLTCCQSLLYIDSRYGMFSGDVICCLSMYVDSRCDKLLVLWQSIWYFDSRHCMFYKQYDVLAVDMVCGQEIWHVEGHCAMLHVKWCVDSRYGIFSFFGDLACWQAILYVENRYNIGGYQLTVDMVRW